MSWDALVQGERPVEPGASISPALPHTVGGPVSDKVEVAAGIWADGETFGPPGLVNLILHNRALLETKYDQATSLLQQGIEQGWTRNQYMAALSGQQAAGPTYAIRSTLEANKNLKENPRLLQRAMQALLESFTQKREILRQAKPRRSAVASP